MQLEYGLIAEEVAKIYPELVISGADGKIESVQYYALIPMLLNELQRQERTLAAQARHLEAMEQQNRQLQAALSEQQAAGARLAKLEAVLRNAGTVASR